MITDAEKSDDSVSSCSEATIDDIYYEDNDPLFEFAWKEVWREKPLRVPIAKFLGARLTSIKKNKTMNDFYAEQSEQRSKFNKEMTAAKNLRLRQFEKIASAKETPKIESYGPSITIVPDLKNIKMPGMFCKYGKNCYRRDCSFLHPTDRVLSEQPRNHKFSRQWNASPSRNQNFPSQSLLPSRNQNFPSQSLLPSRNQNFPSQSLLPPRNQNFPSQSLLPPRNQNFPSQSLLPPRNQNFPSQSLLPPRNQNFPSQSLLPPRNFPSSQSLLPPRNFPPSQRHQSLLPQRNFPSPSLLPPPPGNQRLGGVSKHRK